MVVKMMFQHSIASAFEIFKRRSPALTCKGSHVVLEPLGPGITEGCNVNQNNVARDPRASDPGSNHNLEEVNIKDDTIEDFCFGCKQAPCVWLQHYLDTSRAANDNNSNRRRDGRVVTMAGTRVFACKHMKSIPDISSNEDSPACVVGGVRREWPNYRGNQHRTPGHEEPFVDPQ